MQSLSELSCEACHAGATLLTTTEIAELLTDISDWDFVVDSHINKLKRVFTTNNYTQSIAFTNAVAELATQINHHPVLIVEYASVTVIWWSHEIQGLHKNDFIMASKTSLLFIEHYESV